jgi:predicted phosphatase
LLKHLEKPEILNKSSEVKKSTSSVNHFLKACKNIELLETKRIFDIEILEKLNFEKKKMLQKIR